jgi:hypothetical protein
MQEVDVEPGFPGFVRDGGHQQDLPIRECHPKRSAVTADLHVLHALPMKRPDGLRDTTQVLRGQ